MHQTPRTLQPQPHSDSPTPGADRLAAAPRHRGPGGPRRGGGARLAAVATLSLLTACGGGGGDGGLAAPAGPLTVTGSTVLAGDPAGAVFRIALPAGAVGPASVQVQTADQGSALGQATAGAVCGGSADYIGVTRPVEIPAGSNSVTVTVQVCPNTAFEPTETFELVTSYLGATSRGVGTLLNNAAGGLNDTGIDQCLNSAGALVACAATDQAGQDGQFGRDANALTNASADGRLGFAFVAAGTGCVEDRVSGLTWDGAAPATASLAAAQARVGSANAAALCGFSDWRLPNPEELLSLVDGGAAAAPRIEARFTTAPLSTPALAFWSATPYAADTRAAWLVDFSSGAVAFDSADNPLAKSFASRLVRGSSPATASPAACDDAGDSRFVVGANGTVTDSRSGLMWQQCVDGQTGAACAGGSASSQASFGAALQRASAVNADAAGAGKGFNDWRVPNRNELASLVNRRCGAPTIVRHAFPGTPSLSLWTSSPAGVSRAWYVDFTDGSIGPGGVSGPRGLRLVRGG